MPQSLTYNMDCMDFMKECKDKQFDLAIVDPPYGIGITTQQLWRKNLKGGDWDSKIPDENYFNELFRISKHQIIWGGNYFIEYLFNARCFVVWDKINGTNDLADCELAWTSFDKPVRKFSLHHFSNGSDANRIHPTQKPVKLYKWLLKNYAKEGNTILDTHLGSGSSRIACYDYGFDFTGIELDKDYFEAQEKRFNNHVAQQHLFKVA